jgi:ketosteroid isomerase-like protein
MKSAYSIALLFVCVAGLHAQQSAKHAVAQSDSVAVTQSVDNFLIAFNSLEWEPFIKSFADDATIFFPEWEQARRVSGIKEIAQTWVDIFPEFKDSTSTLTLGISPRDIKIQLYEETAIVTFHLGKGEKFLSRRTLVMLKIKEKWKIAHLHASTLLPENK